MIYGSFYMIKDHQISLPAGNYFLRSLGTVSVKVRAQIETPIPSFDVSGFVLSDLDIERFIASPRTWMSVYNQYPNMPLNIHFSTFKDERVLIAFESSVSYVLYDDQGNVYNADPQLGFQYYELPKGNYRIFIETANSTEMIEHALSILMMKD